MDENILDEYKTEPEKFKFYLYREWLKHLSLPSRIRSAEFKEIHAYKLDVDLGYSAENQESQANNNDYKKDYGIDGNIITGTYTIFKIFITEEFANEIKRLGLNNGKNIDIDLLSNKCRQILLWKEMDCNRQYIPQEFLWEWLNSLENYPEISREILKEWFPILYRIFCNYQDKFQTLYHKNNETIETLPPIYRPSFSNKNQKENVFIKGNWKEQVNFKDEDELDKSQKRFSFRSSQDRSNENVFNISYFRHYTEDKGTHYYLDYLSGGQIFFSILKEHPKNGSYYLNKLILQLYENALTHIMIIDERVQDYVINNGYYDHLYNINIIIPHSLEIDGKGYLIPYQSNEKDTLQEINITLGKRKVILKYKHPLSRFIDHEKSKENKIFLINNLIIHNSILEEMFRFEGETKSNQDDESISTVQSSNINKNPELDSFFRQIKLKYIPSIIVTSGKGKPATLSKYAKFLPFSNIENFVMQRRPEKFLLTQIIFKTIKRLTKIKDKQ